MLEGPVNVDLDFSGGADRPRQCIPPGRPLDLLRREQPGASGFSRERMILRDLPDSAPVDAVGAAVSDVYDLIAGSGA
jgi:hypothetical protein